MHSPLRLQKCYFISRCILISDFKGVLGRLLLFLVLISCLYIWYILFPHIFSIFWKVGIHYYTLNFIDFEYIENKYRSVHLTINGKRKANIGYDSHK